MRVLLGAAPCDDVQALIERRLEAVRTQLGELHRVEEVLEGALRGCRESAEDGRCRLVEGLSRKSSEESP